jgi:hypothetical protein
MMRVIGVGTALPHKLLFEKSGLGTSRPPTYGFCATT